MTAQRHHTDGHYRSGTIDSGERVSAAFGHLVAIVINLALLYVVRHLGDWDLLTFLTDDYDLVVGAISLSIIATIAGQALHILFPGWRMGLAIDGFVTAIGFYALLRIFQVFPFEFDPDGFRWDLVARFILVAGLFGSAIGVLVTPLRLLQTNDPR